MEWSYILLYAYVLSKIKKFLHELYSSVQYLLKCLLFELVLNKIASMGFLCLDFDGKKGGKI